MARRKIIVQKDSTDLSHWSFRLKEAILIIVGALALFFLLALITYHANDSGFSVGSSFRIKNAAGRTGAYLADFILSFLGYFGYIVPILMGLGIWVIAKEKIGEYTKHHVLLLLRFIGALMVIVGGASLCGLLFASHPWILPQGSGGIIGTILTGAIVPAVGFWGALLVLLADFAIGLTLFAGVSWVRALIKGSKLLWLMMTKGIAYAKSGKLKLIEDADDKPSIQSDLFAKPIEPKKRPWDDNLAKKDSPPIVGSKDAQSERKIFKKDSEQILAQPIAKGQVPSVDLLDKPNERPIAVSKDALHKLALLVEEKLADFGVDAKVVGICPGPVITRFELQLAPGIKVSKLSGLSKDLARSLSAISVRIVEVIPGKSVVGVEVPNDTREIVRLRSVLENDKFLNAPTLTVGLGKDIGGDPEYLNLVKMPHLLVAGTTGSGKSVCLNVFLVSMLLKSTPQEMRLIMIDPKMLELSVYEGIPHLLTPVVTNMKEAANALRWCVQEVDHRYRMMAALGVRNLESLNDKVKKAKEAGEPLRDPVWKQLHPEDEGEAPILDSVPFIVVVVDEFADLIMVVGKKVEELITRLAQKARAAGIHMVLATQRPSVDVITGLIKANVPARIAFQVSARVDSRTIIDQQGAEQLLGHGDMLYLSPGSAIPNRIHGAFVSDSEVHAVVAAWRSLGSPEYVESILQTEDPADKKAGEDGGGADNEYDELYDEAVKIVIDSQRASISGVQRRLRIGYNRAARLIEKMEEEGLVSEMQSSGMREVLVPKREE